MCHARFFDQPGQFEPRSDARFTELLRKLVNTRPKLLEQFPASLQVALESAQSYVIPARQNSLSCSGNEGDVHLNLRFLADAIEPPDALLQQLRIERQIE